MAKKKKKTVNKKPSWVGEIDLSFCERGLVYNIYQCRECILEYKEDHKRPNRKKSVKIPGYAKPQVTQVCKHREPLLIKYKKCNCGQEYWGFYLREKSTCKVCGLFAEPTGYAYYRLGEFFTSTDDDLTDPDRWDCLNRRICLEITKEKGARKGIACKGCPDYEVGSL